MLYHNVSINFLSILGKFEIFSIPDEISWKDVKKDDTTNLQEGNKEISKRNIEITNPFHNNRINLNTHFDD